MKFIRSVFYFLHDGFRTMPGWARKLWIIILLKLTIMFLVIKMFFSPNYLKTNFQTQEERSRHVLEQLTKPVQKQ